MDYVGELLPAPIDITQRTSIASNELQALAWKVTWDKRRGWLTFVRVYSGKLRDSLVLKWFTCRDSM
jgi:elongation factor G